MASLPIVEAQPVTPLVDPFGRLHRSLRLSVTDRCNLRCRYCMPESPDDFGDSETVLTFDEITRVVRILVRAGIQKVRVTGGEPTLRRDLPTLIARLRAIPGLKSLAMTTHGMRLPELAQPLRRAGLSRVNISLDAVSEASFQRVTRRQGVDRVIAGIDAALDAGFEQIRLNALAIRGLNDDQVMPLVRFALSRGLTLRFIEYMPLGGDRSWRDDQVLTGEDLRQHIEAEMGQLHPLPRPESAQTSQDYRLESGAGTIGFINPVSEPFCGACDRLRLTAEGALRNCLFSHREWPLRERLRGSADDESILAEIRQCVDRKQAGHLIHRPEFRQPDRPMYRIGG